MPTITSFNNILSFSRGTGAMLTDSTGKLTYAPNNLLTYSEQFDNGAWIKSNMSVTPNVTTAPDGTLTADKIVATNGATTYDIYRSSGVSSPLAICYSIYIKAAECRYVRLSLGASFSPLLSGFIDLTNGSLVSGFGWTAQNVGNGWWRIYSSITTWATSTDNYIYTYGTNNTSSRSTGDGTSGIYIWGAQVEAVTYQTSPGTYNPTTVKNMLGYSESFDNAAWTKSAASIVPAATANPINGSITAQKLMEDNTNNAHVVQQSLSLTAIPYTLSAYARAAERSWIQIVNGTVANCYAYFNLNTGATGTIGAGATSAKTTYIGNGWWRCSITFTAASGGNILSIRPATADATSVYTGDGNSGVYIWGAQLSDSASLDPYVPTPGAAPSASAYYGPRFDYNPVSLTPKGMLIEEARTNNFTYSRLLNNAYWTRLGMTITEDQVTAPDGTLTADKCEVTSNEREFSGPNQIAIFPIGSTAAWSVYAKKGNVSTWPFRVSTIGTAIIAYDATFNFDTGTFSGVTSGLTASAVSVGSGWYRLTFVFTVPAAATSVKIQWRTYVNSTSGVGDFAYFWGAQAEAGSFATSYIPTVASQVTRTADVAAITGANFSNWYNQSEGTLVSAFSSFTPTGVSQAVWTISDGTNNESWFVFCPSTAIRHFMVDGGVTQASIDVGTYAANSVFKSAMAIRLNSVQAAVNGVLGTEDTNATIPTVDRLGFGTAPSAATSFLNGHIRSINYYPYRLSDTQLQTLTI